ncbi:ethanolamine ammonia-lyase subunit EutC [Nocardioides lentus]|uniref:Ethanolamine ammonia-lyase small subunit n=1 Tax=Nocardioides lentus TaxID=338077 RepID=A0ABP5ASB4_9ACTN
MTDEPATDPWAPLRRTTQARIGLGRAGTSLPTRRVLEFATAHAAARDAVHEPLDVAALVAQVAALGLDLGEPVHVESRAATRGEYLRRPDLGRVPASLEPLADAERGADVAIVLADGLSSRAMADHGAALLGALVGALRAAPGGLRLAVPVVATQARLALGDHVGEALGVDVVLVVIGERPGLSVADSLGIYLTLQPRPGRADSERNCISNVHPPDGLGYDQAARVAVSLVAGARRLGRSGVDLKDRSGDELVG